VTAPTPASPARLTPVLVVEDECAALLAGPVDSDAVALLRRSLLLGGIPGSGKTFPAWRILAETAIETEQPR
jgi:hypothetical protein